MPGQVFVIVRDARGSLVHVRRRDDGECVGCIEVGLFEIVKLVILAEDGTARGATEQTISTDRHSRAESSAWREMAR